MKKVSNVAEEISKGGGVYARALVVGPKQERWLQLLEKISRPEVERAVSGVIAGSSSLANAAKYLNVRPSFLLRYKRPLSKGRPLPPYRAPRTAEEARPIVRARVSGPGPQSGGWGAGRVMELLEDPVSREATLEVLREVAAPCANVGDFAEAIGVTRAVIVKWRARWSEVDDMLAEKSGLRKNPSTRFRVNGKRRLSLEEAIDLMRPHLPGRATDVAIGISEAEEAAVAAGGEPQVLPSARELSFYLQKPDARGLMVSRWADRWGSRIVKVWALVDTTTGKRIDEGILNDGRSGKSRGRPRTRQRV